MTLGQWFGHWLGNWFGTLEAAPEGSIAGSATITVGATGTATAIGHTSGTATVTINGTGALTDGGVAPVASLDQILAILRGRKVCDSTTGLWRVYDATGVELADPSGVLLRGLHGWLLQTAAQQVSLSTLDQILAILMGRKVYDSTTGLWRVYDANGVELADPSGILLRGLHGWLLQANQRYFAQEEAQSGVRRLMYYQLQERALLKRDEEAAAIARKPAPVIVAKKRQVKSRIVKAAPREVVVPMDPSWYNAPAEMPKFSTIDWAPLIKASNALAEVTRHEKLTEASNDTRRLRRDEEIMLLMAA